jgi:hypothetical protein
VIAAACFVAACETGGSPSDQDPGASDARDAFEEYAWPDLLVADPAVEADAPHDAKPDAPPGLPYPVSLSCTGDDDCVTACGKGPCSDGLCVLAPAPGRCLVPGADPSVATCYGQGQSQAGLPCLRCSPEADPTRLTPSLLRERFDETPLAHPPVVEDLCGGGITWHVHEGRARSGTSSLYFGDSGTLTYAPGGVRVASAARYAGLALPEGMSPRLSFFLFLATEETEGYDVLSVQVTALGHATTVFSSDSIGGTTAGVFRKLDLDLSPWAGSTVEVAFVFDSIDGGMNAYEGAYLDDIELTTGCCGTLHDCDDADACTADECPSPGGTCRHQPKDACCSRDEECEDGDPCTADRCPSAGGGCVFEPIAGCCHATPECDDGDECTLDECPAPGASCLHRPLCCEEDADCVSGDPCFAGSCAAGGLCAYVDTCCHSDPECDDDDPCTVDLCNAGACGHKPANVPGCCFPTVLDAGFDAGPDGFSFGQPVNGFGWQAVVGMKSHGAPGALYFGDPVTKSFISTSDVSGEAVSPVFALEPDTSLSLSFWYWLDTDADWSVSSSMDARLVADGKEYTVWTKDWYAPQKSWTQVIVDVSAFGGRDVALKFTFNASVWDYYYLTAPGAPAPAASAYGEGAYVDDVVFTTSCAKKTCTAAAGCPSKDPCLTGQCQDGACVYVDSCCSSSAECDDGNLCTTDTCLYEHCQFTAIKGCCVTSFDCADSNACTEDWCPGPGLQCENPVIPGCCLSAKECDDGDKCTKDTCVAHECAHANVCCATDADCDDGDDVCTIDACVDQFCKHAQTGAAGCCPDTLLDASFEGGDLGGFEVDPPVGGVGWNATSASVAYDGAWSLYYGNPATMNFDNGNTNSGNATSPVMTIPAGYGAALDVHVWMDTETSTSYDMLTISWVDDTGAYGLWSKGWNVAMGSFFGVKVNLSAFAGRTGQVRFSFDTKDAYANSTKGVFLDAVLVTSTCAPVECGSDAACDDGLAVTADSCLAGTCTYEVGVAPQCVYDWDCDDDDYCTYDWCTGGVCQHEWDPWCWYD